MKLVNLNNQKCPKKTLKKRKEKLDRSGIAAFGLVYEVGSSRNPIPWEEDGIEIVAKPDLKSTHGSWYVDQEKWGVGEAQKYNISAVIADFYLLEAIKVGAFSNNGVYIPPFTGDKLLSMLKLGQIPSESTPQYYNLFAYKLQTILVNHLSKYFRNYLHFVVAGEAAHHGHAWLINGEIRSELQFRLTWHRMVRRLGGELCSGWAVSLFNDFEWGGAYGGSNWAEVAEVLNYFESGIMNKAQFCDRVFSLQHCGGTILDRAEWRGSLYDATEIVLYAHGSSDWRTLYQYASDPVKELYDIVNGNLQKNINWKTWDKYPNKTYKDNYCSDDYW